MGLTRSPSPWGCRAPWDLQKMSWTLQVALGSQNKCSWRLRWKVTAYVSSQMMFQVLTSAVFHQESPNSSGWGRHTSMQAAVRCYRPSRAIEGKETTLVIYDQIMHWAGFFALHFHHSVDFRLILELMPARVPCLYIDVSIILLIFEKESTYFHSLRFGREDSDIWVHSPISYRKMLSQLLSKVTQENVPSAALNMRLLVSLSLSQRWPAPCVKVAPFQKELTLPRVKWPKVLRLHFRGH